MEKSWTCSGEKMGLTCFNGVKWDVNGEIVGQTWLGTNLVRFKMVKRTNQLKLRFFGRYPRSTMGIGRWISLIKE